MSKEKEELQFAVSSISCSEYKPSRVHQATIPKFATERMVERMARLRNELGNIFPNISISAHPGFLLKVDRIAAKLLKKGIEVSSIDTPDIDTNLRALGEVLNSLFIKRSPKETMLNVGWRLHNVGSKKEQERKIDQGLKAIEGHPYPKIVRTHAGAFLESTEGEELRKKLAANTGVILAVEIEAGKQTPAEYLEFLQRLASTSYKKTPVYADIDLGHLGESKYLHKDTSEIPEPLEVFESILSEKSTSLLVAVTSLNQYSAGDMHTHTNLMHGPIDLVDAAGKLGKAAKDGMLPFSPMTVAEFYPFEYEQLISEEGKAFWRRFKGAYDVASF